MRRTAVAVLLTCLGLTSACGSKIVPAPALTTLAFPDFVAPVLPSGPSGQAVLVDRGWRFLQAGHIPDAERELQLALRSAPSFYPAEAALAYVSLAQRRPEDALAAFDRVLANHDDYLPGVVGRGLALLMTERDDDALAAFERAAALDPGRGDFRRRVEVLRFRRAERRVAGARQAARLGQLDDAERAYRAALAESPDSAFLHRELAAVEISKGAPDAAVEQLRMTVALEPDDAESLEKLADMLEAQGDLDGALRVFERAVALNPSEKVTRGYDSVRAQLMLNQLPPQYRAIGESAAVSRGELAALIGVRLAPLVAAVGDDPTVVVTDARGHWAEQWIVTAARTGIMQAYANHTFQPRVPVRRIELAEIAERMLTAAKVGAPDRSALGTSGDDGRPRFSDLAPTHAGYNAATTAISMDVMRLAAGSVRLFKPNAPATGEEAVRAVERLAEITHMPPLGALHP